ncbi:MAG: lysophospholipid acyltransferase family protein [Terracidiphilus sp.]|nr:lysophospholipid acyltransferase family protein [Terracidiphilus sp.]
MKLRAVWRAVTLAFVLFGCMLGYWKKRMHGPLSLVERAYWLQSTCRRVLRSLGIHSEVVGDPPQSGVVVANHLSYLDVVILSSAMPCFFVAKAEIDKWPFFGWAARIGGTLFIDRSSLASATKVAAVIAERLALPVPVLFFPEGTSTDGSEVLRFHSRLFEPPVQAGAPITTATLRYLLLDGSDERDLCWFGDDAFLPHLWKALGTKGFTAEVRFGEPQVYPHRRVAADLTHAEITAQRNNEPAMQLM